MDLANAAKAKMQMASRPNGPASGLRANMEAGKMPESARAATMNPNLDTSGTVSTGKKIPAIQNPKFDLKTPAQQKLRLARRMMRREEQRAINKAERANG